MKNTIHTTFLTLIFAFTLALTGCETDPCETVTCYYGGACLDGSCDCATADGYEGEFCQTEVNKKFNGFNTLTETCSGIQPRTITVEVSPSITTTTRIRIEGLNNNPGFPADGFVDGALGRDFSIPRATYGGEEIEGDGSMSSDGSSISITYRIYDFGSQAPKSVCTGTITK